MYLKKNDIPPDVVIFGDDITSFSVIRGLKKLKINIYLVSDRGRGGAIHSKFVKDYLILAPDNPNYIKKFIDWVKKNFSSKPILMIAGNDDALKILSKNHKTIKKYTTPAFPNWKIVKTAINKNDTNKIAKKLKIPIIQTDLITNILKLNLYLKKKNVQYPVFLKCTYSRKFSQIFGMKNKGIICNSNEEVIDAYKKYKGFLGALLIQEFIPGDIDNIFAVLMVLNKKGKVISVFANEKVRSATLYGGTTLSSTIWKKKIIYQAVKLAEHIRYSGFINVQFKFDPRDKKYKLLEINGRFTTSTFLDQKIGFNFSKLTYEEFCNKKHPRLKFLQKNYKEKILLWFPFSDFRLIFQKRFYKNLKKYIFSLRGRGYVIAPYSLDDPRPFLLRFTKLLKLIISKILILQR